MSNAVNPLFLDHFDATTLTGDFQLVTDTGLQASCSTLKIINASNMTVIISYDGINDHDCIRIGEPLLLYFSINSRADNKRARLKKGQLFWVRRGSIPKIPTGMIYFGGIN